MIKPAAPNPVPGNMNFQPGDTPSGMRLLLTMLLNFLITIVEVIGGLLAGSLSLMSDALHNFSDGLSIIISYSALRLGQRPGSRDHTFGFKRAEILAAILNSATLIAISLFLFREAYFRFKDPAEIKGTLMVAVAGIGLTANILGTWLLHRDSQHNLNIRSTYLHLLSDVASSLGVIIGGFAIILWQVYWVDPLLTVLIALYVLKESFDIVRQATHILMMGTPANIALEQIQLKIESVIGVTNLHHVHVWMLSEHDIHFEAHVDINDMLLSESATIRQKIENLLADQFDIQHVTLQMECGECESSALIV